MAGGALAAMLCLATWWSVRLARADWLGHQGSREAVRRAAELASENAVYPARLGEWREAVARNPYDSASLIRLGLDAEERGDYYATERSLLRAAKVDHLYEPRWALANYYLRRRDWGRFWNWARQAGDISPEPPRALFRLCREATPDLGLIFERLSPRGPRVLGSFLYWVGDQHDRSGLLAVTGRAVEIAGAGEREALLYCLSEAVRLDAVTNACRIWNRMIERGLLSFERLVPESGASLTNGDFRFPPEGETFNWRLLPVTGVTGRWRGPGQMRFEFSGTQPERCALIEQTLPLLGGCRYRLSWRHRMTGIAPGAGPVWAAGSAATSQPLSGRDAAEPQLEFTTPPGAQAIHLCLEYRRQPGTTRIEGVLLLSEVRLQLAGPR